MVSLPIAFVSVLIIAPFVIKLLKRFQFGQIISEDAPESHQKKAGTPSMGGIIILIAIIIGVVSYISKYSNLIGEQNFQKTIPVFALIAGFALLGFIDDYLTIRPFKGIRGIASKPKSMIQFLLAVGFVSWLGVIDPQLGFKIGSRVVFGGILYKAAAVLFIVGMANFVNITDGLDGLVTGLVPIAVIPLLFVNSNALAASLMYAIIGACFGFLWFNCNPAKVFMGDTGSLALGVALPAIAIVNHCEIVLVISGLLFILDGLSSALQWAVFKYTRIKTGTGRRIFKKSPVHHHFELSGIPEQEIVVKAWILQFVVSVIAIAVVGLFHSQSIF